MKEKIRDEIDILKIIKKLIISRKLITYSTLICMVFGIIFSLLSPVKYSSSTIFIPQNQDSNQSGLSSVASLVGINLSSFSYGGDIPSSMYPQISQSPKFKRLLLSKTIDLQRNLSLKDYIIDHYKLLPESTTVSSPMFVSKQEEDCFEILSNLVSVSVNNKDGMVTILSTMSNAKFSAVVANNAKEILQTIIIENKIESARQNLVFTEKQLSEKKLVFDEIQSKLAYFSDSNLNSVNSFVINERKKLQAEFEIINTVVTELSKVVEEAKLQVKKDTPVFSTLQEAVIPNKRISPHRKLIVIYFMLSGFILSSIFVIYRENFVEFLLLLKN